MRNPGEEEERRSGEVMMGKPSGAEDTFFFFFVAFFSFFKQNTEGGQGRGTLTCVTHKDPWKMPSDAEIGRAHV